MMNALLKHITRAVSVLCLLGSAAAANVSASYEGSVTTQEWARFADAFVAPNGRVIDTANDGISHSEGQGYGLMLAWMAGDHANFERIWTFTRQELQVRNDGLFAWKWAEGDRPRVRDINNATDGDILIAYALEAAGASWGDDRYRQASADIRNALKTDMFVRSRAGLLLLPGGVGFTNDAGTIINPSYWVQEAFTLFAEVDQDRTWAQIHTSLDPMMRAIADAGPVLAPEWVQISNAGGADRAPNMDGGFGYNAMRVPLYIIRDGGKRNLQLAKLTEQITTESGDLVLLNGQGQVQETLTDPGYRALAQLSRCAVLRSPDGVIPSFTPTEYYPSVLHLLSLSAARVKAPECTIQNG